MSAVQRSGIDAVLLQGGGGKRKKRRKGRRKSLIRHGEQRVSFSHPRYHDEALHHVSEAVAGAKRKRKEEKKRGEKKEGRGPRRTWV